MDMNEVLKGKTVLIENSEREIGTVVIVDTKDLYAAKDAINQALNIWLNYEDSDEHKDDLTEQIQYIFDGRNIKYYFPYYEEI